MKSFVLVGKSLRIALPVLQAIRSFSDGHCIIFGDEATCALRLSRLCKQHNLIDLYGDDDESFVAQINTLAKGECEPILIPFDCEGIRLVHRVRSQLNIKLTPIPDSTTLEMLDDKWSFHEFCARHLLLTPPTRFIGSKFDLNFEKIAAEFGLPFVLKPTNCSGSIGVQIIAGEEQFEREILHDESYVHGALIVQKFIEGVDIGIDLLSINGRLSALAVQQPNRAHINFLAIEGMEEVAEKICSASGYHGPMNIDARVEKETGKVFFFESNPRFWATTAASVYCGLNFVAKSVNPAATNEVLKLNAGACNTRHPLMVPSTWWGLMFDRGERGRLLRAKSFDLYTFGALIREFPLMASRFTKRTMGEIITGARGNKSRPQSQRHGDSPSKAAPTEKIAGSKSLA